MCRNIKTLYNFEPEASREEIDAAKRRARAEERFAAA